VHTALVPEPKPPTSEPTASEIRRAITTLKAAGYVERTEEQLGYLLPGTEFLVHGQPLQGRASMHTRHILETPWRA
jgi:DNA-binding IclR family transcriptional regulator